MRELFGVEFVDGVVDGAAVGEIDAAVGESGGDLFGGAPGIFVVEGGTEGGQVGIDGLDDRGDPAGAMSRRVRAKLSHRRSTSGRAVRWSASRTALRSSQSMSSITSAGLQHSGPEPVTAMHS